MSPPVSSKTESSLSFLPLLLADTPAPTFDSTTRLGFRELFDISPLGCVGMLISGGVFSAMFGMASVWGAVVGAAVLTLLPQLLTALKDYEMMAFGAILIATMIFFPRGIVPTLARAFKR